MTHAKNTLILIGSVFVCAILGFPAFLKGSAYVAAPAFSSPPVAVNDTFTRHGNGAIGNVLTNDSDPDGDALIGTDVVTFPNLRAGLHPDQSR